MEEKISKTFKIQMGDFQDLQGDSNWMEDEFNTYKRIQYLLLHQIHEHGWNRTAKGHITQSLVDAHHSTTKKKALKTKIQ